MKLVRYSDISIFSKIAEPYLTRREAEHNLLLGLLSSLDSGRLDASKAYLAAVHNQDTLLAIVLRTDPTRNVLISCDAPDEVLQMIAEDMMTVDLELRGVTADSSTARAFAEVWQHRTKQPFQRHLAMRIYKLTRVIPPRPVSGHMRAAEADDRTLVTDWVQAFQAEALQEPVDRADAERLAVRFLDEDASAAGIRFWVDDGKVVAQAAYSGRTPNGIRTNLVYTPPELRGKGYASAVVAQLSQEMLDRGRKFCFLFTDLSNPTSNHIYQAIGYEPVNDVDEYRFGERG